MSSISPITVTWAGKNPRVGRVSFGPRKAVILLPSMRISVPIRWVQGTQATGYAVDLPSD